MSKNVLIIIAVAMVGVAVYLLWRQSTEKETYYRETGESFMYKYGGDIISLIGGVINKKKGTNHE